ncbi:hypothetical protein BGW36DRAFT_437013 [Talaromyces proteolyticus]|uniref:Uncharacterized protein n=1 Tax=Talaromyces proteolyticus TaxID=1131652 RepID=A0AAD4PTD6_9EURO|nr:uncharacterized protein BGW36DRAFT_437013 [Talaromyces proteolyticus]KAH8693120.1 hypothetical protein BGW36DRAFT_437013 [Talaromyces proteolyticus]
MAATLRRTFRYSDDGQDNDDREELDEEEQDNLIRELNLKNNAQNAFYYKIFTIMPLIATVAYLPSILSSSVTVAIRLSYIMCIASLCVTAHIMRSGSLSSKDDSDGVPGLLAIQKPKHPTLTKDVEGYLLPINSVICVILFLQSWYSLSNQVYGDHQDTVLCALPGVILGVIRVASRILLQVDIEELENLRYEYKGA